MKNIIKLSTLLLFVGLIAVSCKDKSKDATVGNAKKAAEKIGASYIVVPSLSKVMWVGEKPTGAHNGTLDVSNGKIAVDEGSVTGGTFTLDMNTITVLDIEGDGKLDLEAHLKGTNAESADHFFDVGKYPTASFDITKVVKQMGAEDGTTHLVYGNLTIKGISKEIGIRATIDVAKDGISISTPEFTINRTNWGINYKSKTILDDLKDGFIKDDIKLKINLKAKAE